MALLRRKIREWAVITRITVLIIQACFNILLFDHDAGDIFRSPRNSDSISDWFAGFLIGGLGNWDGEYFIHIANYGYTYENCLVFFPLFPMILKLFSKTLGFPVFLLLNNHYGMLFLSICVNFICFIISAEMLYELSRHVLREERLAYYAALFYCINPATVFFTAAYTETLFALFVFIGMLFYEKRSYFVSSLCFALGSATRSNGIICCGFIFYNLFKNLLTIDPGKKRMSEFFNFTGWSIVIFIKQSFTVFVHMALIFAPFISHQTIAYKLFCDNNTEAQNLPSEIIEYGEQKEYTMPFHKSPEWCFEYLPISYSHIQEKYWNVGFLRYYQFRQIPNFLLALPVILCIVIAFYKYFLKNWDYCICLGLKNADGMKQNNDANVGVLNLRCFPYLVHVTALTLFGCIFINIQVLTRMICSSSPVLYWFAANGVVTERTLIPADVNSANPKSAILVANRVETFSNLKKFGGNRLNDHILQWTQQTLLTRIILSYFLSFLVFGTLMFVNFYPFT